jgi:WD40 repeat protein
MSVSTRRVILFVFVPVLLVVVLGLLAVWGIRSFLGESAPVPEDLPGGLARVSLPHPANSLTWSADGKYLAAGSWGSAPADGKAGPSEVYVADVARASVASTLTATGVVQGLAFAPDGTWLVVSTAPFKPFGAGPGVLTVFEIPAGTARFTAKPGDPENGFFDLAWAPDGTALYAIEGSAEPGGKAKVRRWDLPTFAEQPAVDSPQTNRYTALAVSPDRRTLAVAENDPRLIRLFDTAKGSVRTSFGVGSPDTNAPRLGFTPDGKAIGVFERVAGKLSWWDPATGRATKLTEGRFAIQPAALGDGAPHTVISPDGTTLARGAERHRGFGDLGWDNRAKEFGSFVEVTDLATATTRNWRVSDGGGSTDAPVLAFSPDGTKLAGTIKQADGASIVIWAVPK